MHENTYLRTKTCFDRFGQHQGNNLHVITAPYELCEFEEDSKNKES